MNKIVFLRYGVVAGVAYVIDFGGYILLMSMGYTPVMANILIKVVAAIFGFFAHRHFTYSIKERNDIGKHAAKYFGLALFYTPMSSLVLYSIMFILPNPIYAKATSDISLFVVMFWITSKYSFKTTGSV